MRAVLITLAIGMLFLLMGVSEPNLEFFGGCAQVRPTAKYIAPNAQGTPSYFTEVEK